MFCITVQKLLLLQKNALMHEEFSISVRNYFQALKSSIIRLVDQKYENEKIPHKKYKG